MKLSKFYTGRQTYLDTYKNKFLNISKKVSCYSEEISKSNIHEQGLQFVSLMFTPPNVHTNITWAHKHRSCVVREWRSVYSLLSCDLSAHLVTLQPCIFTFQIQKFETVKKRPHLKSRTGSENKFFQGVVTVKCYL